MKSIFCVLALMMMSMTASIAAEAPKETKAMMETLLKASAEQDIEKFQSVCGEKMKKIITPDLLKQINAVLKGGYKKEYFGMIDRVKIKTYYWKIDFDKDGAVDLLAEMSVIDGKVAGFYLN